MELSIEEALQRGITAHKNSQFQEAEKIYRAILISQPNNPDANHNLGLLVASLDKVERAIPFFETALKSNPKIIQFWASYIDALIKIGRLTEAKKAASIAKSYDLDEEKINVLFKQNYSPGPPKATINSILNHYRKGKLQDAEILARKLNIDYPNHPFSWKVLGVIWLEVGKKNEALSANQKALKLSPNDPLIYSNLGLALKDLGRLPEAQSCLRQAIILRYDFVEGHNNLGIILQKIGKFRESETSFRKAIKLKPDFGPAHNNLGNVLYNLGQLEDAEASYRKAIQLKPDYPEAQNNLAVTQNELGRWEQAEPVLKQALLSKYNYAAAHNNLGNTLQALGKLNEAEASYAQAVSLEPNYSEAQNNLGSVLLKKGKHREGMLAQSKGHGVININLKTGLSI